MEYAIELNKMSQQQRDNSGLDNEVIIRLAELKDKKLIPNQLTPTQLYNVKHIGVYRFLVKGLTTFADIEHLPRLSDAALLVLSYEALQSALKINWFNLLEKITFRARLYKIIEDADKGLSADEIIEKNQHPRKYRVWGYIALSILPVLTYVGSYLYHLNLATHKTTANANKIKIAEKVINASYIASFSMFLGLPFIMVIERFLRRGVLWLKDAFSALDTKVHQLPEQPVGEYFESGLYNSDQLQAQVNQLNVLVQRGILTNEFNEKGDIDNNQLISFKHPAVLTMLTANRYAVHLSSYLQVVGRITKHQALVLSNATIYAPFSWSFPFNVKSNSAMLRKLLRQSENQDAILIVKKQRRGYLLKGLVFAGLLSAIYPILSQAKVLSGRTLGYILNPFIALITSFIMFPLLGKFYSFMRGCFCAEKTTIDDFVFVKGRKGPEQIQCVEKEAIESDIEAGPSEKGNQKSVVGTMSNTGRPMQITVNNGLRPGSSSGVGLTQPLLMAQSFSEGSRATSTASSSNSSRLTQ